MRTLGREEGAYTIYDAGCLQYGLHKGRSERGIFELRSYAASSAATLASKYFWHDEGLRAPMYGYFRLKGISVDGAQCCGIHWIKENKSRLSIMG